MPCNTALGGRNRGSLSVRRKFHCYISKTLLKKKNERREDRKEERERACACANE